MNRPKIVIDQCPPSELLKEFAIGTLHPNDVERVVLHLSSSPNCTCQRVLATFESNGDEFTAALGASLRVGPLPAEAEAYDAIVKVESIPESTAVGQGDPKVDSTRAALPNRVGRYRVTEQIGRGGMGVVYRARDEELDRDVAIKIVRRDRLQSDSAVLRFRAEAQAAARLDHPHIVPIYEVGVDGEHYFLAMKLIEGGALAGRGKEYVSQPRRAAQDVAAVARAIHYAHQRQILHRDLKPGNILRGPSGSLHVVDFGLARRLDEKSDLTQSGAIVGTPSYMAPEQAAGALEDVTTATDVYGLGAVLYYLLTDRPPHDGATPIETCRRVVDTEPTGPRRLNPGIDRDLETICLTCLAKSPTRRYNSAAAIANDLDRYLSGQPILARTVGTLERLIRWSRRRPAVAALAAVVLLLAALIGIGSPLAAMALQRQKNVANHRANEATRNLFDARTALARAERLGDRPDRRSLALAAVRGAVEAAKTIEVDLADLRTLRNEAVGSLALADIQKTAAWGFDGKTIHGNAELGYFAHTAGETNAVVLRRIADFAEIARLPDIGLRPARVQFLPGAQRVVLLYERKGPAENGAARTPGLSAEERRAGSAHRTIALWQPGSHQPTWIRRGDFSPMSVLVSPDGTCVVTAGNDGTLFVLDAETAAERHKIATGLAAPYVAVHPSRPWVAVGNGGRKVICYDLATGERTAEYVFPDPASGFAWQPNGKLVAVTGWDGSFFLWDVDRKRKVRSMVGHERLIVHVSFNATGELVATQSYDGTTRIWSTASGLELARLPGGPGFFSRSGARLAVAATELGRSSLELWDCRESRELSVLSFADTGLLTPRAIAITPDGSRVIAVGDDGVHLFDIATRTEQQHVAIANTHSVTCHPDGKHIIVNGDRGLLRIRLSAAAVAPMAVRERLAGESRGVLRGLAQSADGERLAATVGGGRALLIDLASGSRRTLDIHKKWSGIAVRGDGQIVAAFLPQHIGLWQFDSGEPVAKIAYHGDGYARLTFSPDGQRLVVGDPLNFRCYNGATWLPEFTIHCRPGALWGVSTFSPNGRLLAIADTRDSARLLDSRTGAELCTLLSPAPRPDITALRFTPDGTQLLVAGSNRVIQVWNITALRRCLSQLGLDWVDGE